MKKITRKDKKQLLSSPWTYGTIAVLFFMAGVLTTLFMHPTLKEIDKQKIQCMRDYHGTKRDCAYKIVMNPSEEIPIPLSQ